MSTPAHTQRPSSAACRSPLWPRAAAAVLGLCAVAAALGGTTHVELQSQHVNQLSGDPLIFENFDVSGNSAGSGSVRSASRVSQPHISTFQDSQFEATATFVDGFDGQPILLAHHAEKIHLWGENPGRRWIVSQTEMKSQVSVTDTVTWPSNVMAPQTWEWAFKITASFSQTLDINAGQSPLYRLSNQLRFFANSNGAVTPVDVTSTTFDPDVDANPPQFPWSLLRQDVNLLNQPVTGFSPRIEFMKIMTERDPVTGALMPVNLFLQVDLDSNYNFLNDASSFNYGLTGDLSYDFRHSAEVLGFIARDANGAIITDLEVHSAAGFRYRNLGAVPEPSTWALMIAGLLSMAAVRRRRRPGPVGDGCRGTHARRPAGQA